jgi:hypothetical protein
MMLIHTLQRGLDGASKDLPARQNRRTPLLEQALEPLREELEAEDLDRLVKALGVIVGTESWLAFKDVLRLDETEARRVRRWMIRALIAASLAPAAVRRRGAAGQ